MKSIVVRVRVLLFASHPPNSQKDPNMTSNLGHYLKDQKVPKIRSFTSVAPTMLSQCYFSSFHAASNFTLSQIHILIPIVYDTFIFTFTGLTVVIQAEAMELVPVLSNPEMISKDDNVQAGGASNNKLLTGILFEFCHSILLQFSFEELSQVCLSASYPSSGSYSLSASYPSSRSHPLSVSYSLAACSIIFFSRLVTQIFDFIIVA